MYIVLTHHHFYIMPIASATKSPKSTGASPRRAGLCVERFCKFKPPMSHHSTPPVEIGCVTH